MLAIRLQRTGRKGHAQFRMIVQESRRSPSSGSIVAALGSYDPHTKVVKVDAEKASTYLNNGAQPSPRVAVLLQKEGVKMPSWVTVATGKQKSIKHTDKLRRNRPAEEVVVAEAATEEVVAEAPAVEVEEVAAAEAPAEETAPAEAEAPEATSEA